MSGGPQTTASGWRALAPAKINLGLFVGPVRADGRHLLASVMQSISLADELQIEVLSGSQRGVRGELDVSQRGVRGELDVPQRSVRERAGGVEDELVCPGVEGPAEKNLALRALRDFRGVTGWDLPAVRLTVDKRVPVAAGLGGGSADAAAALRLAAALSRKGDLETLLAIAAGLGADVPAQVQPGRWLACGAGEELSPLPGAQAPLGILVLPSKESLSTAAVYAKHDEMGSERTAEEIAERAHALASALASGDALPPPELLHNDLQAPAIALCPSIEQALEAARSAGADLALLSGSGPTVLGLFGAQDGPHRAQLAAERLNDRKPAPVAATSVTAAFGEPQSLRAT